MEIMSIRNSFFSIFRKYHKSFSQICNENPSTVSSENKLSRTHNRKVASSSLGLAGIVGGGSECSALSPPFNTTTEVPLSKAPNLQLLLGRRTINGCPLLRVCVHGVCVCVHCCVCVHDVCVCSLLVVCTWMGKCRAQIPSMGHLYLAVVTSLSLSQLYFR